MFKKALYSLLALLTIIGSVPMMAMAQEELPEDSVDVDALAAEYDESVVNTTEELEWLADAPMLSGAATFGVGDRNFYEREPNNYMSSADLIYNDYTVSGSLSSSDRIDYYKFTLSSRSTITMVSTANKRSFMIGIVNPSGTAVAAGVDMGYSNGLYSDGLSVTLNAGTYYVAPLDSNAGSVTYMFYINWESAAHTHSYGSWVRASDPTCTTSGYDKATCSCGDYKTRTVDALGHDWDEGEIIVAPTASSEGTILYTCNRCDDTKEESITIGDDHVCSFSGWTVTREVTCDVDGEETGTCYCGETETRTIPAPGHSYSANYYVTKRATCTEDGVAESHCSNCDAFRTRVLTATGHSWDSGRVTTSPTVFTPGERTYSCTNDGCTETRKETIPATGSSGTGLSASSAMAIELGKTYTKSWTTSNYSKDFYTAFMLPEDGYITISFDRPTDDKGEAQDLYYKIYDEKGKECFVADTEKCNTISSTLDVSVPLAKGIYYLNTDPQFRVISGTISCNFCVSFTASDVYEKESNNTQATARTAEINKTYNGFSGAGYSVDHINDYWRVDIPASAAGKGTIELDGYGDLEDCGSVYYIFIDSTGDDKYLDFKLNNKGVYTADVTYTTGANYFQIKNFGTQAAYSIKFTLPHTCTYGNAVVTKEATCTEKGVKTSTCSVCGAEKTSSIEATGHKWDSGVVTTEATCTKDGVKAFTCTACSDTKTSAIAKKGHKWDSGKITKQPTETEDGVKTFTCTRSGCNSKRTESIPALNAVVNITRLSGKGRTQTAVSISKQGFSRTSNVILASGDNYADALAGVPLAYALNAPILLVQKHQLNADTLAEIERLGATNIYILGGAAAIGDAVVADLESRGCTVERIKGKSRFDTAVAIAERLEALCGKPSEVFFAFSHNYPDALAISGIAAAKGCPVLYIAKDGKLSDSTAEFVAASGAKKGTILGGTGVISPDAEKNIKKVGITTANRISGKNRYITCIKINEAYADVLTGKAICLATGTNFPDALAGGVFAALNNSPMLLVDKKGINADQESYISTRSIRDIYVFGGAGVVSDDIANQVKDICE